MENPLKKNCDQIVSRIKEILELKSDVELARYFDVTPQAIQTAKNRQVPLEWLLIIRDRKNVSLDWLMSGEKTCVKTSENVAEPCPFYAKKLFSEEEKIKAIKAYIDEIILEGPRAQNLFANKFIECFADFQTWYETKYRNLIIQPSNANETKKCLP